MATKSTLRTTADQVQETAELIRNLMMQYKMLIDTPKDCTSAVFATHCRKLRHTRDTMLVSVSKVTQMIRQFENAKDRVEAACKETN